MKNKHSLVLLPNLLEDDKNTSYLLPQNIQELVTSLDGLIAESEKEGRKYLRQFLPRDDSNTLPVYLLNEHTSEQDLKELLNIIKEKKRWGLISDAGLPCLADPGSSLVLLAHQNNIEVEAYMGPSSIILALMLSGLYSQQFTFHGYLPRDQVELKNKIYFLEKLSKKEGITHIWIEAPYRSKRHLDNLIKLLHDNTMLSIAYDLTLKTQRVITRKIKEWKKHSVDLHKQPTVFLINAK